MALEGLEARRRAEAVLDVDAVARRQRTRRLAGFDEDLREAGALARVRPSRDLGHACGVGHGKGAGDAAGQIVRRDQF